MARTQAVEIQNPAVRAFLRSLNILLKSARMYGMAHAQTSAQASDAWEHLQSAFSDGRKSSLQLAVSENRLLVDGLPVKVGPAEQSFAQFLASADLASITFTAQVRQEAFLEMVRLFGECGAKPVGLVEKLKEVLGDDSQSGIRINEIRFVPAGSDRPENRVAAQLLAQTFGADSAQMQGLLDDPLQLLKLITAAEGEGRPPGSQTTTKTQPAPERSEAASAGGAASAAGQTEGETGEVIRLLSKLAREGGVSGTDPVKLHQEFAQLPQSSQETLRQALAEFAQSRPQKPVGAHMLLQVAEHLAVQLALDRYEKGDARVDAVAEMLNRLNREVDSLREALGAREEKVKSTGFEIARPSTNTLEQQFWARAPESAKLDVLLSDQAWRVPTHYIRQYLDQLPEPDGSETLQQVLVNYASCIHSSSPDARQKTAQGLKELAGYFPRPGGEALQIAIGHVGEELAKKNDPRLQNLISATFVLLGQEAATRHRYAAILQMLAVLEALQKTHKEMASDLWARVGVENRVPDFLEEVLRGREASAELIEVLHRLPQNTVEHLAGKTSRCARRRERERLVKVAQELGPEAAHTLCDAFRVRPPAVAVTMAGLLTRLDPAALEDVLLARLHEWNRVYQDAVVRQIAGAGASGRGILLAKLLDLLDPLVAPLALDEIGMSGETTPAPLLLAIAAGDVHKLAVPFLRIKAIEALGRLRVRDAIPLLRQLVESKEFHHSISPRELRLVAGQSLQKIDPQGAKAILSGAGFRPPDLQPMPLDPDEEAPGVRQRYYPRARLRRALAAKISTADGDFSASIRQLSLGGGICFCEHRLLPGTPATIRIKTGLRSFIAKLFLRDARSDLVAFEIVDMDLEDRARLRTLLQAVRR